MIVILLSISALLVLYVSDIASYTLDELYKYRSQDLK